MTDKYTVVMAIFLIALSGCGSDGNGTEDDTGVDDTTGGDVLEDTDPGDVVEEGDAGDSIEPDSPEDVPPDEVLVIPEPGTYRETITVDDLTRSYVLNVPVTVPAAMAEGRVPFLIALHGAGDTGENFIFATRLTDTAAANAFVIVGPNGFNRGWFVSSSEGWPGSDGYDTSLQNDLVFMLDLIDYAYENFGIDRNRVYVCGHSRGAGMTGMLAFGSGLYTTSAGLYVSEFAAFAVNAGYDATGGSADLTRAMPKRPIWVIHGTSDSVVPYSSGESFANDLTAAGWDTTWTSIPGGSHTWLFQSSYGYTNQDLWDYFAANPIP
jgi:poly(3-hydroxybutyrate) depolymerase